MQQEWIYRFGHFSLYVRSRVLVKYHEPISLPAKSFDVLVHLVQARGRVVTKDELMEKVWRYSVVEESNIYQSIYRLRSVLRESSRDPIDRYIENISGTGYRFAVAVSQVSPSKSKPGPGPATVIDHSPVIVPGSRQEALTVRPDLHSACQDSAAIAASGSRRFATSPDRQPGPSAPEAISGFACEIGAVSFVNKLTPTERKVLRMIADNQTSRDIAVELSSSVRTIENHRARIRAKLGLSGSNALVWFAAEHRDEIKRECNDS